MIKKLLLSILLVASTAFASIAQTTSSFSSLNLIQDTCVTGPNPTYRVFALYTIANFVPNSQVLILFGDSPMAILNTLNYGSPSYVQYFEHTYDYPGTYQITMILYEPPVNGIPPGVDTLFQTIEVSCSAVKGNFYKRADTNCIRDFTTEHPVNAPFQLQVLKSGVPVDTITVNNGYFYQTIDSADLTSVFTLLPFSTGSSSMTLACPTNGYNFKFDTLNNSISSGFQFGFDCNPSTTFDLSVFGQGFFRPVATSWLRISPRNTSCIGTNNASMSLHLSPKYNYFTASIAPSIISGNFLTWNFGAIENTDLTDIYVFLTPASFFYANDTVQNYLSITPTTGDLYPADNSLLMVDSIRSSFDPNEKHVIPATTVEPGQKLTYTINFENLGNDTAFNIYVLDTLSSFVDVSSFKVITSSHTCNARIISSGTSSVLKVDFPNILLADSTHPELNKGFVTYEIKAKANIPLNTIIENTAFIYFDINPAVVTNTTKNRYAQQTGIKNLTTAKALNVYPNPAKESLLVEGLDAFSEVHILNVMGQHVLTQTVKKGSTSVSIAQIPAGIYFIQAEGKDGIYAQKFVKE